MKLIKKNTHQKAKDFNCLNCGYYTVTESGTYNVEVTILDDCISYGEIIVEYANGTVLVSRHPFRVSRVFVGQDNMSLLLLMLTETSQFVFGQRGSVVALERVARITLVWLKKTSKFTLVTRTQK